MTPPNAKPLMVSERIESARFVGEADSPSLDTMAEDLRAMSHGAWRTLNALRTAIEGREIQSMPEMYGLVLALEATYECLAR